jgi:hypothetical protein
MGFLWFFEAFSYWRKRKIAVRQAASEREARRAALATYNLSGVEALRLLFLD